MKLDVATLTDPGRERKENEDNVWAQTYTTSHGDSIGLFVVCDGMGGHLGGKHASYWAIEAIKHEMNSLFCPTDPRATLHLPIKEVMSAIDKGKSTRKTLSAEIEELIIKAIQKANLVVYEYAVKKPQKAADAGTTITLAVVHGDLAIMANVGDSRTYLLHDHQLTQISRDHSLVASLVANGQLEPHEIYSHPQRNMIYRSLGQKKEIQVDIFHHTLSSGDTLLLCSDGLWEMVQDDTIIAGLIEEDGTLDDGCTRLVEAANTAGGEDNIGVVLARVT
ncbi:Stp1/IreP family PP2C-type Ser/Thr phosphatase [Chloroflexota bacterium]